MYCWFVKHTQSNKETQPERTAMCLKQGEKKKNCTNCETMGGWGGGVNVGGSRFCVYYIVNIRLCTRRYMNRHHLCQHLQTHTHTQPLKTDPSIYRLHLSNCFLFRGIQPRSRPARFHLGSKIHFCSFIIIIIWTCKNEHMHRDLE